MGGLIFIIGLVAVCFTPIVGLVLMLLGLFFCVAGGKRK